MRSRPTFAVAAAACLATLVAGTSVKAADINLMTTGAVEFILRDLIPPFERATGHKVNMTVFGTVIAVDKLKEGAVADLVLLNPQVLGDLTKAGKIVPGSITPVFHSRAGAAVKAGAPKPDISTVEAFKQALLKAKTIGHSLGVSGVHFTTTVIPRLGIADQIKDKLRPLHGTAAQFVAKGDPEIALTQIATILPFDGVDFAGPFPPDIQLYTIFTAVSSPASDSAKARALLKAITAPEHVPALREIGLDPPG